MDNETDYIKNDSGEFYKGISREIFPDWLGWIIIDELKKKSAFPQAPVTADEIEIDVQLQYEVKYFHYQNKKK